MSSTDQAGDAVQPSRKARPVISLMEFLVLLDGAVDAGRVGIRQVTVNGLSGEVSLDVATPADVTNLVVLDLGKPQADIDVQHQADGAMVTSYNGQWNGWTLRVQHVHRTPTIQEGTIPA